MINIDNNIYMIETELDKLKTLSKQDKVDKEEIEKQINNIMWEIEKLKISVNMKYTSILIQCADYNIIKEKLSDTILNMINDVLIEYEDWKKGQYAINTDIEIDYTKYHKYYGCSIIIEWYEGLMDTEGFIQEILNI